MICMQIHDYQNMYLHNLGTSGCEGRQSETLLCVEQKQAESQYLETGFGLANIWTNL